MRLEPWRVCATAPPGRAEGARGLGEGHSDGPSTLARVLLYGRLVAPMPGVSELVVADGGVCGTTARGQTLCWDAVSHVVRVAPRLEGTRELVMGSRFACGVSGDGDLRCASLGTDAAHAVPHGPVVTARR